MDNNKDLISVIVPVYNAEKYIAQCIESICKQTYANLEIILIDDGSTDNSGGICDKCAEKDARIKVIYQKNAGVSAARNAGLDAAHGNYIGFVDADDYLAPQMYSYLYRLCTQYHTDISMCNYYISKNNFLREQIPLSPIEKILDAPLILESSFLLSVCDKLFSYKLKTSMYFDNSCGYGEDMVVCLRIFEKAPKIAYGPIPNYYYRKHIGSATASQKWNSKYLKYFENIPIFLNYAKKHHLKNLLLRMSQSQVTLSVSLLRLCLSSNPFDRNSALILQSYIRHDLFFYLFKVQAKISKKLFALSASINLPLTHQICLVVKKIFRKR